MVIRRYPIAGSVDLAILGLSSFVLGYGLLKASELFSPAPVGMIGALHETPSKIALSLLMMVLLLRTILGDASPGRGVQLLLRAGMFMMACGLVVSSYVRFEGKIVLTEGQQFSGNVQEYVEGSLYSGKKTSAPHFGLEARDVTPRISKNGFIAEQIVLRATYGKENSLPREISIGSGLPWFDRGLFFRINRFGYSPLFRFADEAGNVLQEFFWPLELFPPGSEDSLRSLWIPHVFYVRYLPAEEGGRPAQGGVPASGLHLRIVRNIDLVYEGEVALNEPVTFDSMGLTIPEVRMWVEVAVVQDHGMLLFFAGGLLAAFALVIRFGRRNVAANVPAIGTKGDFHDR